jgi:hypothetical protein
MSSATSIDKAVPRKGGSQKLPARGVGVRADAVDDAGFRPWHFFVLASLMAATGAVVIARQSTPENLVLISLTIGAAGAAAAGFYRMLAPLATDDVTIFSEPLTDRQRAALEHEKTLVLRSIKELEFDRAMGKLSPKDFEEMSGRLRARALSLMKELDEGGAGYREIIERELRARIAAKGSGRLQPGRVLPAESVVQTEPTILQADSTCACGAANDADAAFCKRCGARLS